MFTHRVELADIEMLIWGRDEERDDLEAHLLQILEEILCFVRILHTSLSSGKAYVGASFSSRLQLSSTLMSKRVIVIRYQENTRAVVVTSSAARF